MALDHSHVGFKRKYEKGVSRGKSTIIFAANSLNSGLWNVRIVENERQPCTEHNTSEIVADSSDLRTDIGGGLNTVATVEGKNFGTHGRVNHSGVLRHHINMLTLIFLSSFEI